MLVLGVAAASAIFASEGRMLNPKYNTDSAFGAYLLFAEEEFDNAMQGIEFTKVCDNAPSPTSSTEAPSTDDSTTDDSTTDDSTTEEPTTAEPYDASCDNLEYVADCAATTGDCESKYMQAPHTPTFFPCIFKSEVDDTAGESECQMALEDWVNGDVGSRPPCTFELAEPWTEHDSDETAVCGSAAILEINRCARYGVDICNELTEYNFDTGLFVRCEVQGTNCVTMTNGECSFSCPGRKINSCDLASATSDFECYYRVDRNNRMCVRTSSSDPTCKVNDAEKACAPRTAAESSARVRRDDNTCANGATPTYVAADLRFGGMIVDASDPSLAKHETFYFGTGDTKYSTTKTPLTYTKEERSSGQDNSFWLYKVQISHPLVRSYGAADSAVYIWTRPQSWMPDRKELHTTVNADDTSIKIVKEDDDTNAPRKDDTIALHNQDVAINRTVVGVTQFAAANGDAYWEVELDEAPGHVFEADANTHVKLHETSPERDTDLGDSGSSGLSGGALGGIIGGSIGGVLLIAVAVTKFMPGKKYSSLEGV